ncbi:uncharacterized protein PITG_14070 [Phytophthora infestans T30-4]|uniref:Uncharacterized protein n=1 Tax=Phytophthora infestans (strain T30-4) TaxID=403677 RepID=D0NNK3_PHYIT|nr:uncharacterized protein PITG_14070 [Phytophthora infestans T30-4]EEY62174.1 hypothetical protein PITG_14070 [Phytophthora infestans T30-4]|eukprot:XP_002899205.1 hypothetical protein PITG_14070 [Phytophthora infestans T30-4]
MLKALVVRRDMQTDLGTKRFTALGVAFCPHGPCRHQNVVWVGWKEK